jgi:hypothetical protein
MRPNNTPIRILDHRRVGFALVLHARIASLLTLNIDLDERYVDFGLVLLLMEYIVSGLNHPLQQTAGACSVFETHSSLSPRGC